MCHRGAFVRIAPLCLALGIAACDDPPPPGKDLVLVTCTCHDGCVGGQLIQINGQICTDASNPDNVQQAIEFICSQKETIGFNVCKIENCGEPVAFNIIPGGCPVDNGDFSSGDFGQSRSVAVPPSKISISGDDINDFDIAPEEMVVDTTQAGSSLFVGFMTATLATTQFTSDGIFGDDDHTIAGGRLSASPFMVTLAPDGTFSIPAGTGTFIVTGVIDGDRLSLTLTSINLHGQYNEELGLFTLAGNVDAVGADISIAVDIVFQFQNRPPRAVAGMDQVVECGASDETGKVHLSGEGSFDLEGEDDIARFTWYVDGQEAAVGKEVDVDMALGQRLVTLIVADQRGSFGGDTADVLVEDTTPPVIDIVEPQAIQYTHSDTLVLDYTVTDGCTGVAGVTPLLDGAGMLAGHGLANGQSIQLLTELALGDHTFSIDTADEDGNASSASVTFSIVVTPESIQQDVHQFYASGDITQRSGGNFLLRRLMAAAGAYNAGNCNAAVSIYQSFINTIEAQRGKTISNRAADIMIADARFLIEHCPDVFAQLLSLALRSTVASREFIRGDANDDGDVDLSDAIFTLSYLFLHADEPMCLKSADANDDGVIIITDAVAVLGLLFGGAPRIPPPYPACGSDQTPDELSCRSLQPCGGP